LSFDFCLASAICASILERFTIKSLSSSSAFALASAILAAAFPALDVDSTKLSRLFAASSKPKN
jgi:hypothetical protein